MGSQIRRFGESRELLETQITLGERDDCRERFVGVTGVPMIGVEFDTHLCFAGRKSGSAKPDAADHVSSVAESDNQLVVESGCGTGPLLCELDDSFGVRQLRVVLEVPWAALISREGCSILDSCFAEDESGCGEDHRGGHLADRRSMVDPALGTATKCSCRVRF